MDDAISESYTRPTFLERLKAAGATPNEAQDYISQFSQCGREHEASGATNAGGAQPQAAGQVDANTPSLVDIAMTISWVLL